MALPFITAVLRIPTLVLHAGQLFDLEMDRALRSAEEITAQAIVGDMRRDAPRRTGRLRSGIKWYRVGENAIRIVASARRARGADYAGFVERGTRAGVRGRRIRYVADSGYFNLSGSSAAGYLVAASGRQRNRNRVQRRGHPGTRAQPFFFKNMRNRIVIATEIVTERIEAFFGGRLQ